MDSNQSHTYL